MISRMDNLREGAASRILKNWAPALFTLLALVGAVGLPLQSLYSVRRAHQESVENSAQADTLRSEYRAFTKAGGEQALSKMERETSELLPRDLSTIYVRAALQWIAVSSGLEVRTLSVGEAVPATYATLDDSVGISDISISGLGGPSTLDKVMAGMQGLGYPISMRSYQLTRLTAAEPLFEVQAVLELFQAIPPQAAPQSEDFPMEDD